MIGISGGANQATFRASDDYIVFPGKNYTSLQFGVFIKPVSDKIFHNGLEINYRRKSSDLSVYTSTSNAYTNELVGRFDFDYLSFMYLPELRFGKKYQVFINAGPFLSLRLGTTFTGQDEYSGFFNQPSNYNQASEIARVTPAVQVGFAATGGFNYTITENWQISLSARYFLNLPKKDFQTQDLGVLFGVCKRLNKREKKDRKRSKLFEYLEH